MSVKDLTSIIEIARKELDNLEEARDRALKKSRDIIRLASKAVTAINSGHLTEAQSVLKELENAKEEYLRLIEPHPQLRYSGFTNNSLSEYAEANIYFSIIVDRKIPSPQELGIDTIPYLLGLADTIGELRRQAIEKLRQDEYTIPWEILSIMEEIYMNMRELDYPESMVPGLRRKIDVARRLIEDLKTLLVDIKERKKLMEKLDKLKEITGYQSD